MGETWIDIVGTEHVTRPMVEQPSTNVRFISPRYFESLRVGLRGGRDFEERDRNRKVARRDAAGPDAGAVGAADRQRYGFRSRVPAVRGVRR